MKIKYLIYFLLIVGSSSLIFYRIIQNNDKNETNKKIGVGTSRMNVNGIIVQPQKFSNLLSLSGSIEADEQVEIRGEISGLVEEIFFREGSSVIKGQVLLKINDMELRAQMAQAKTKQTLASENERRGKLLLEKEAISREEYDVVKADLMSAQAQTQLIEAQMNKTTIKAPFSGKIGLRNVSPGTYLTPTTLVAKLVNSNEVKITFSIPEKYATLVKVNSNITFKVAGSRDEHIAKVYAIEPEIDVTTRTLKLRAVAKNPNGKLLPGTFATITLALSSVDSTLIVPTEAIIPIQNGKKLFILEKGKAKEINVETSTRTDKEIVVIAGLKPQDTVLTTGVMSLREGLPVTVTIIQNQ